MRVLSSGPASVTCWSECAGTSYGRRWQETALACPRGGGRLRLVALIEEAAVIDDFD